MLTPPSTSAPVSESGTSWHVPQSIGHPDPTGGIMKKLDAIEARLKRIESRLCQFMLDQGSHIHLEDADAQR